MLADRKIEVECFLQSKGYPVLYFDTAPKSMYFTDLFSVDTCDEQILSVLSLYIRDVYSCDAVYMNIKRICTYDSKIK